MSSIKLNNVSLDYIIKNGSNSIKKSAIHLLNNCFRKSPNTQFAVKNSTYRALDNINLEINKGDRIGLLGRNGAGKSTLLRVLAKVYQTNIGKIEINGKICSLFDVSSGMNTESTGYENIVNLATMRRISKKKLPELIKDVETFTELGDFLNSPVKVYSAGMLLKLAFAVATAIPPEIMLIDEIIGVGDIHFMEKATKRLEDIIEQSHILVLASHSNEIIKRFCNKVIVLERGQIQFFGDVEQGIDFYTSQS
ncbi:ABC transporter ATP-binding protein [Legionella rowbothamii]|uniref:ABC transporter ATP-binding protein n=1 Tax=Legionella rowbothamii TaxID=96229 RepID=UPI001054A97A|nr:ABC transporter ATP-binding protein [Legionella rowbothamii]